MRIIFLIMIGFTSLAYADFTKSNSVVIDSSTHLVWQDDYSDNNYSIKSASWEDAIKYCEALSLNAKSDWRLPNLNELSSLVDDKKYNPAIDTNFQYTNWNYYWSSTSLSSYNGNGWLVHFASGIQDSNNKTINNYVRCVRAGE